MDVATALLAAAVGYLVGCISFVRLVGRFLEPGQDVGKAELVVPGTEGETMKFTAYSATTVSLRKGPKAGCLISLLDMVKVAIPTLLFKIWYPGDPYFLITATAGVAGHNWPVFYRFKGGRGYSAIYGGLLVIDWPAIPVTAVLGMLFGLLVLRDFLMAYIAGLWFLIPWFWFRMHDPWYVAYAVAVAVMFMVATVPEIKQYMKFRREGKVTISAAMTATDMGRSLSKVMDKLHLRRTA
jgi:glycerol-3-phosphate acyltransferase PlsY